MKYKVKIFRFKPGWKKPRYDIFEVDADEEEYLIDVLERIRIEYDPSLTFTHACNHGVCGSCAVKVNGIEKLACTTKMGELGREIVVEPLDGFPVVSDLVVDYTRMFKSLQQVKPPNILKETKIETQVPEYVSQVREKFSTCIECGICYSACPIANTYMEYLGPAALARVLEKEEVPPIVDSKKGVWSCHMVFECSSRCPVNYSPGEKIMKLRKTILKKIFRFRGVTVEAGKMVKD